MESQGDCIQEALAKNGTEEHTTTDGAEFLIDRLSNDIKKKPQRYDNRKTANSISPYLISIITSPA